LKAVDLTGIKRSKRTDVTSYLLPLEVLVELMKDFPEQVLLQAPLSSLPGFSKEPCVASMVVGAGSIYSCMIKDAKTGKVLKKGPEAVIALRACGELHWMLQRQELLCESGPLSHTLKKETGNLPRRTATVTSMQMQALPHTLRKVLSLVNGTNSLEHIAYLLNKSPQEVSQLLLELQKKGLISL
jgi:hypothetical protein